MLRGSNWSASPTTRGLAMKSFWHNARPGVMFRWDIADIRKWYVERMIKEPVAWHELSAFEQRFAEKMIVSFEEWRRQQLPKLD